MNFLLFIFYQYTTLSTQLMAIKCIPEVTGQRSKSQKCYDMAMDRFSDFKLGTA